MPAMLSDVACAEVNVDMELYRIYICCKEETDFFVCKKWPSVYGLNLKVALLEKGWTTLVYSTTHLFLPVHNHNHSLKLV